MATPPRDSKPGRLDRRRFIQIPASVAAAGLIGEGFAGDAAFGDSLTRAQRDRMTPAEIVAALQRGNERFRTGKRVSRNYLAEQRSSAKGQYPAAAVLSCVDSRAPAEVILDLGIGDIFNARVAGNVCNTDILGSLEFACKLSGAKVAVVMGHTNCGAIKGAIDGAKLGNLTELLAKIRPAVEATAYAGERTSKDPAFVDAVARTNVQRTLAEIREKSPVLREMEIKDGVDVVGAMYDLETAAVTFF